MHRTSTVIGFCTLLACVVTTTSGPAQAGDLAQAVVVGFSADGRYVAFEEYGAQDGSGFPYSNIYVLDVAANDWVSGSPIRVLIDYDQMDEEDFLTIGMTRARQQAMQQAGPVFSATGIVPGNTGTVLVHHPYSDTAASPYEVPFSIGRAFTPYLNDDNLMRLSLRPVRSDQCAGYGIDQVFIFTLDLIQGGGAPIALQEDRRLPDSRVCPTDYRIERIVVFSAEQENETLCCAQSYSMLVLVGMQRSPGFEGPDYRYLGVSGIVPLPR